MAKIQLVTDDLDGAPEAQTIRFGINDSLWEIDLAEKNLARLTKALEPFVAKASPVQATNGHAANGHAKVQTLPRSRAKGTPDGLDDQIARRWAQAHDFRLADGRTIGNRGRLHPEARAAWVAAGQPRP